jgi:hypothetical protein
VVVCKRALVMVLEVFSGQWENRWLVEDVVVVEYSES